MRLLKKNNEKLEFMLRFFMGQLPLIIKLKRLLNRKNYKSFSNYKASNLIDIKSSKNTFFGYYDSTPFNMSNPNILVFHSTKFNTNTKPAVGKGIDIIIYNIKTKEEKKITKTNAWNWQQGSRIHWIDEETILFNDYQNGLLHSVSLNIFTNDERRHPISINAVYRNLFALTLDYVDLTAFSEYGYEGIDEKNRIDGIIRLNLKDNSLTHLISKNDIEKLIYKHCSKRLSRSHINHISINPAGNRFIFIFRGYINSERIDNLLVYNFGDSNLSLLIGNTTISHYSWLNDTKLILWGKIAEESGYFEMDILDGSYRLLFNSRDGHPSVLPNGNILSDTYPDKYSNQELYIYNTKACKKHTLLKVYHPTFFQGFNRCDLHPSLSSNGKIFQIDTRYKRNRTVLIGEIPECLSN